MQRHIGFLSNLKIPKLKYVPSKLAFINGSIKLFRRFKTTYKSEIIKYIDRDQFQIGDHNQWRHTQLTMFIMLIMSSSMQRGDQQLNVQANR